MEEFDKNIEDADIDNNKKEEVVVEPDDSDKEVATITHPFNPNDISIQSPPFTVGYLVERMEHDEIDMNTEFQRSGYLWNNLKQSRLIESILLNLPLPAFYFDASKGDDNKWLIVDGLQRCCALERFCIKKGADALKLENLEFLSDLNGKTFDELDRSLQRRIITRPITINKIIKADPKVRYALFKRLNSGGVALTAAEIRHAVYQGVVATTVKKLAKSEPFREATDKKIPELRMEDRDFVSRFIAFYLIDYNRYNPNLDNFVNNGMEALQKLDSAGTDKLEHDFYLALGLSKEIFGNDAFRKRYNENDNRKPINKAYFEVITVSLVTPMPLCTS